MPNPTCTVPECEKPARSKSAALCRMHYHRQYRHGDVQALASKSGVTASHGRRYRSTHRPNHPLAPPSGRVYVHRIALFDSIGAGQHPCHWCVKELSWLGEGDMEPIVVDHLNGIGDDNRVENLVPSCEDCNKARGAQARSAVLRENGWWSQHDTPARLSKGRRAPIQRVVG